MIRMCDIITKKRDKKKLSKDEIQFFIDGYVNNSIPDYQASALLMAIYFNGMSEDEITDLTMCMALSGDVFDLECIDGIKVDKHSTGGVGDKTTLIISSIVASCGIPVAKMSGRGLGFTGGTIDKMESIPGLRTDIKQGEFLKIVKDIGMSIIGQSGNIVPADKKLYALRDVTGTVESIPLIASSVMSKKIAAGSDCILLDVKVGSGAFIKKDDDAIELSKVMVNIGRKVGKKTIALITDMNCPIGSAIGNSLEISEVFRTLKGKGPNDLTKICLVLASNMLYLAKKSDSLDACAKMAREAISSGNAFSKLKKMVSAQGGDIKVFKENERLPLSAIKHNIYANSDGYLFSMDAQKCGIASMILGAGRQTKESKIDLGAGILLNKKVGDKVKSGDLIATFYSQSIEKCKKAKEVFESSIVIKNQAPVLNPIVHAKVTEDGVQKFI